MVRVKLFIFLLLLIGLGMLTAGIIQVFGWVLTGSLLLLSFFLHVFKKRMHSTRLIFV